MREEKDEKYKNNRQGKRFAVGIKLYFFIMTMLILVVFIALWVSLYRYQKRLDGAGTNTGETEELAEDINSEEIEAAAQECFLDYVEGMTSDTLMPAWYELHPECFDKESDVKDFLDENIINSGYECFKDENYDVKAPKYTIISDGTRLADFTLSGSGALFAVSKVDILIEGNESFVATIPEGFVLSLNGVQVSSDYASGEPENITVDDYNDDLVEPKKLQKYEVTGLIKSPEADGVAVNSPEGKRALLAVDDIYYEVLDLDEAGNLQSKSEEFVKSLLNYYTKGKENAEGNMGAVLSHVASGSAAAKVINGSLAGVVWMSADYTASYELSTSDVYVMADNCCCVDVSYTQTGESKLYDTGDGTYRVYLLDSGNGYKIVQFAGIK